jgi:hypothetical protein
VLNVAIKVNGQNPMKCVSRFLPKEEEENSIVLKCFKREGTEDEEEDDEDEDDEEIEGKLEGDQLIEGKEPICISGVVPSLVSSSKKKKNSGSLPLIVAGCEKITEWKDLFQVHYSTSSCALLKACFIALGMNEQLQQKW